MMLISSCKTVFQLVILGYTFKHHYVCVGQLFGNYSTLDAAVEACNNDAGCDCINLNKFSTFLYYPH